MAKNTIPKWIQEGPMDFEYKSYMLLSEIERLKNSLLTGNLFEVLKEVDDTLDYLYMYDAEKIHQYEDLANYDLVGIDWQNFQLMFDDAPHVNRDQVMDEICDLAIDKYEDLHSRVRFVWRDIEEGLKCSYVPEKGYFISDGFVFILTPNNKLHTYYFHKPTKYISTAWKDFKLEYMQTEDYTQELYMKHIEEIVKTGGNKIIFKVTSEKETKIEGNAIAVIQYMIYNKLRRDYSF
jgi:hypothetical protein